MKLKHYLSSCCLQVSTGVVDLGLILLLVGVLFLPKLDHQLVGDDWDFITNWPSLAQGDVVALILGDLPEPHQGNFRPVRSLFYLTSYQLWGETVWPYHLFGVVVQVLNSWLVYLIAKKLVSRRVGLMAGLLFAAHPLHVEAITFITASYDSVSFTLLLLSFYLFVKAPKDQRLCHLGLVVGLLAMATNETAYVLPLLLSLYVYLYHSAKKIWATTSPYWYSLLGLLVARWLLVGSVSRAGFLAESPFHHYLVSLKSLYWYVYKLVWPNSLGLIQTLPGEISNYQFRDVLSPQVLSQSLFEPVIFLGLGLILVGLWLGWTSQSQASLLRLGYLWLIISLLPVINIFPSAVIYSDRYGYLASVGFVWILSGLIEYAGKTFRLGNLYLGVAVGLIIVFYSYQVVALNRTWTDETTYWRYNLSMAPDNFLAWFQYGQVHQKYFYLDEAIVAYKQALELEPRHANSAHYLAMVYHYLKDWPQANQYYLQAYQIDGLPQTAQSLSASYLEQRQSLLRQGKLAEAEELLIKANQLQ